MKKLLLISALILIMTTTTVFGKKLKAKDLTGKSKRWLTREVVYIITPIEKDAFLRLDTEFERERFIKGFWKQRDPNPNTEENEFKIEHYKRIKYANKHYGKESPGPGWRSEMGKMHIILGKPNQATSYINSTGIYPTIIWFYSNLGIRGIPNSFNIVFFRPDVGGEYKLYSPVRHGPAALLTNYMGGITDYNRAYLELHNIEQEVANISLSLLPEESGHATSPSITSEVLVHSKIPKIPHDKAYDSFAKNFLNFKGDVKVSHMENFVKNNSMVKTLYHNENYGYVHLLIEPEKLTIEKGDEFLYTTIEVHGNIYNEKNENVYKYSKKIPVKMGADKFNSIQKKRFSFQDMFPLLTGKYRYHFLLMNLAGKEFTSVEGKIVVPKVSNSPKITSLIIGNKKVSMPNFKSRLKPYVINGTQIVPSPKSDFNSFDTLFIYTQLIGLDEKNLEDSILEYSIKSLKTKNIVLKKGKLLKNLKENSDIFEEFSLKDIPADFYSLNVKLKNKSGDILTEMKTDFYIAITRLSRPWVMSMPTTTKKLANAKINSALGKQYFNLNKVDKSLSFFKKAYYYNPDSLEYKIDYINNLLKLKRYKETKSLVAPFLNGKYRNKFLLISAKISFILKDYNVAINLFSDYLKHYGSNVEVLNMLGECYIRLGDKKGAINTLKQSLKKLPKQPKIIKTLKKLEDVNNVKK